MRTILPTLLSTILVIGLVSSPAAAQVKVDSLGLAQLRASRGDHAGAIKLYRELESDRDSVSVHLWRGLAGSLLFSGQAVAAQEAAARGLQNFPDDAPLLRLSAGVYASQGQYAAAIKALQQAATIDAGNSMDHANLGGLLTNLGRYDEAEAALRVAEELAPDNGLVQRRLGALLLKRHRYEPARKHLQQAAASDATSPTLACMLGQALEGEGQMQQALAQYERATRLDPSYLDAHYRLAQVARRLGLAGRADSAMAAFSRLDGIGDADASKQLRLLRDAIMESADQPDHVFALAKFLFDHGLLEESQNRLEAVLLARPDDFQAVNMLGSIQLRRRDLSQAQALYERALTMAPDFAPAALNAGNASMLLQQPARALAHYERALALAPEVAMVWYGVGSAHLALGHHDIAAQVLQQGLQRTRPEGRTKAAFLAQLRKAQRPAGPE